MFRLDSWMGLGIWIGVRIGIGLGIGIAIWIGACIGAELMSNTITIDLDLSD
jgi:hypothetical protein